MLKVFQVQALNGVAELPLQEKPFRLVSITGKFTIDALSVNPVHYPMLTLLYGGVTTMARVVGSLNFGPTEFVQATWCGDGSPWSGGAGGAVNGYFANMPIPLFTLDSKTQVQVSIFGGESGDLVEDVTISIDQDE